MSKPDALTPALSRKREREQQRSAAPLVEPITYPLTHERERSTAQVIEPLNYSLSRERERAGVRVRARALRVGQTDAEALLWSRLRSRQIGDLKFRRQHPIGPYFADFACIELGLVIELDGGQHNEEAGLSADNHRSDAMAALGFQTLRFWNNDVLLQTDAVLEQILHVASTLTPTLSRTREREQEHSAALLVEPMTYPLTHEQERSTAPVIEPLNYSLSRERERAGVRVRARALRVSQTDAEALLWSRLRSRQIAYLKFRRQHPIGPYFADFTCIELHLVIELDGGQHNEEAGLSADKHRSDVMAALGFQTLRFWNNDVLLQTDAVLEQILHVASTLTPTLSRAREREQEHTAAPVVEPLNCSLSLTREQDKETD